MHLETLRLILRPLKEEDLDTFIEYRRLPAVARYQNWDVTYSMYDALKIFEGQQALVPNTPDSWQQFAIELKATGELVGDCALHTLKDERQVEIGYTLAPQNQGKGYMTEAITRLLDYVFLELGKYRALAEMDAKNTASARLADRLGFRLEAHHLQDVWFKGAWGDSFVFAILQDEWTQRRS